MAAWDPGAPRCGHPTKSGAPCLTPAGNCRHHGDKPEASKASTHQVGKARSEEERMAVAQAVAEGLTSEEAAQRTGVPYYTVRNWRQDKPFRELIQRLNDELVAEAAYRLAGIARKAADTLEAGMDGTAKAAQVRAADVALARMLAVRDQVALAARLEALEERLNAREDRW